MRTKDGKTKWVYLNADETDPDSTKDIELWEPPCMAADDVGINDGPAGYNVFLGKYDTTTDLPLTAQKVMLAEKPHLQLDRNDDGSNIKD